MVKASWPDRVVMIKNVIKHNPPESPNVVRSWSNSLAEIPECELKTEYIQHVARFLALKGEAFAKAFAEALPKGYRKALPKGYGKGSSKKQKSLTERISDPLPNQEQEQEQEQEKEERNRTAKPLSLSSPAALESQDQPDQPITAPGQVQSPGSWLPGERRPTGDEQAAIVELQHLWAKLWKKDPPTMAPRGDDSDRMVEALRAGGHLDGETIAMAKRAVRGHHKRASKEGSQMGRDFGFCFPKLSRGSRVIGNRLDFAKYESFALEIKERKPPPPKPPPEKIEPGVTPEELKEHMARIRREANK